MKNYIIVLFSALVLSSCAPSIRVYKETKKQKGIPFYVHKEITEQSTQYLYKWYEVKFVKIEKLDKAKETVLIERKVSKTDEGQLDTIRDIVLSLSDSTQIQAQKASLAIVKSLAGLTKVLDQPSDLKKELDTVSNNWATKTVVDYSTKYYLNSNMPWLGSSTLSQKLSENGTLSEATSTTDSQVDELITAAVGIATPLSSITVARIQAEPAASAAMETVSDEIKSFIKSNSGENLFKDLELPSKIEYQLRIQDKGYLYTFKSIICDFNCDQFDWKGGSTRMEIPVIPFNISSGNYTRTVYPPTPGKKTDDKSTIKVSGDIKLPDSKKK